MTPQDTDEDLTRKQRREQARAQRRALEEAEVSGAARRRRLQLLGGVAGVVVIAVIIILVAAGGGSKKGVPASKKGKTGVEKEVGELVGGVSQVGNTLGKSTAPVTLQYFGDLECPICKEFTLGALPFIIDKWVHSGDLRIEYRSLETATREPETFRKQQVAALAAGAQNKGWTYIETFYHEQGEEDSGYVTEKYLDELAEQVPGLNLAQWEQARNNKKFLSQVEEDNQAASNEGFTGTPSFLLGRSGTQLKKYEYTSLTDPSGWNSAIEALVKS